MAILVTIKQVKDINGLVTYSFANEYGNKGMFAINRQTGELTLINPMPSDASKTYFTRAAVKVMKDWQNQGYLPEKTYWSS